MKCPRGSGTGTANVESKSWFPRGSGAGSAIAESKSWSQNERVITWKGIRMKAAEMWCPDTDLRIPCVVRSPWLPDGKDFR